MHAGDYSFNSRKCFDSCSASTALSKWASTYWRPRIPISRPFVIRHDNDLFTLYAHLSKINVQAGDQVKTWDLIGEVGQSGVATGSHLHFEVRRGSDGMDYFSTQNPELWLVPNMDEYGNLFGVISFSILDKNPSPNSLNSLSATISMRMGPRQSLTTLRPIRKI